MTRKDPRPRFTRRQRSKAESLLRTTADLQGLFWDSVLELEQHLGVLIDETRDLSEWNVRQIRRCLADDLGPISWRERPSRTHKRSALRSGSRSH
jgi:hypothetical protein